ncbi:hypothetical protein [Mycoplasma phocoenae]|uniref:Uncharacterized protein n=1 Tax=Mycoplasma phocoenae TaxID=754517 RepID=A0A858U8N5_9MOLU|nr:hypothetical protein [Mycoplasma phocoenae]QJG67098.1 hypothetical protein HGG69_02120 [Mycoplasma phocoenae]
MEKSNIKKNIINKKNYKSKLLLLVSSGLIAGTCAVLSVYGAIHYTNKVNSKISQQSDEILFQQNKNRSLIKNIDEKDTVINQLKIKNKKLENINNDNEYKIEDLNKNNEKLNKQVIENTNMLTEQRNKNKLLQLNMNSQTEKIKELSSLNNSLINTEKEQRITIDELMNDIDNIKNMAKESLDVVQRYYVNVTNMIDFYKKVVQNVFKDIENTSIDKDKQEFKEFKSNTNSFLSFLESESLQALAELKLNETKSAIYHKSIEKIFSELKTKYQDWINAYSALTNTTIEEVLDSKIKILKLSENIADMTQTINESNEIIKNKKQKISKLQNDINNLINTNNELILKNNEHNEEISTLKLEIQKNVIAIENQQRLILEKNKLLKTKINELNISVQNETNNKTKITQLNNEIINLKTDIKNTENKVEMLKIQLNNSKNNFNDLNNKYIDINKKFNDNNHKINQMQQELNEKQAKNQKLLNELNKLNVEKTELNKLIIQNTDKFNETMVEMIKNTLSVSLKNIDQFVRFYNQNPTQWNVNEYQNIFKHTKNDKLFDMLLNLSNEQVFEALDKKININKTELKTILNELKTTYSFISNSKFTSFEYAKDHINPHLTNLNKYHNSQNSSYWTYIKLFEINKPNDQKGHKYIH